MANLEPMIRDLLDEMADDHVGLWVVISYVEDEMGGADESAVRNETLNLLSRLLRDRKIDAGFPDSNGRDFHVWPFPPEAVIEHIESRWTRNTRPKPGEIAWFTATSPTSVVGHSP